MPIIRTAVLFTIIRCYRTNAHGRILWPSDQGCWELNPDVFELFFVMLACFQCHLFFWSFCIRSVTGLKHGSPEKGQWLLLIQCDERMIERIVEAAFVHKHFSFWFLDMSARSRYFSHRLIALSLHQDALCCGYPNSSESINNNWGRNFEQQNFEN